MSKAKDDAALKQVLDYLEKQNRPYSATDIFNNLHKEHGKPAIIRALELLAQDGQIKEKLNGKQKVYFADQDKHGDAKDCDIQQMDIQISTLTTSLAEIQQKVKAAEILLGTLNSSSTTEAAQSELRDVEETISALESKLSKLQSSSNCISPSEKNAIISTNTKYVKEWRKRKRLASDIIDAVLEGYPKGKRCLLEELGIETDEDAKVSLPCS